MEVNYLEIKDIIKRIRVQKNMSTYELADTIKKNGFKISQSAISKIENGRKKIDVETLIEIAKALNVSIDDIIGTQTTGIQELIQNILNEKKAKNIKEISQKTNIELDKIKSFQNGDGFDPNDFDRIIHTFYGSYGDYIHQSPTQIIKRLANKRVAHDKALDGLYRALEYYYKDDIEKNLQNEIFIGLNIDNKKIFYTKDEFEKFLEYVCLSFPNFKYIVDKIKNKNIPPEKHE